MITQMFLDSPVLCLFAVVGIVLVFFIVEIANKIRQNRWRNDWNKEIEKHANNSKERQVFINRNMRQR